MAVISPSVLRSAVRQVIGRAAAGSKEAQLGVREAKAFAAKVPAGRVSVPQLPVDHIGMAGPKASFSALVPEHHAAAGLAPGQVAHAPSGAANFAHSYLSALGLGRTPGRGGQGTHSLGVATGLSLSAAAAAPATLAPSPSARAYVDRMGREGVAGGLPELFAMSHATGVQIDVFNLAADGSSLARSTSIVPQAAKQRISLLDDGKGIRPMLVNPRETQTAQPFSSARFLPQSLEPDGNGVFAAVSLLTSISPKELRGKACGFLAKNWDTKPDFFAGRTLGEAAVG